MGAAQSTDAEIRNSLAALHCMRLLDCVGVAKDGGLCLLAFAISQHQSDFILSDLLSSDTKTKSHHDNSQTDKSNNNGNNNNNDINQISFSGHRLCH